MLSLNFPLALLDLRKIGDKLSNDLVTAYISQILSSSRFVYSSLELVTKDDGKFGKIHHFSFLPGSSVYNHIPEKAVNLCYTTLYNVVPKVVEARCNYVIKKRDIKNAFCAIPVTLYA